MTGRAGIAAGAMAALAIAGMAGLVLFPAVMAVIGALHRGRYR